LTLDGKPAEFEVEIAKDGYYAFFMEHRSEEFNAELHAGDGAKPADRFVFQGVHMLFDGRPDRPWKDAERHNQLIFIGRNLDRNQLNEGSGHASSKRNIEQCFRNEIDPRPRVAPGKTANHDYYDSSETKP
jgi:hypothetical protein